MKCEKMEVSMEECEMLENAAFDDNCKWGGLRCRCWSKTNAVMWFNKRGCRCHMVWRLSIGKGIQ